MQYQQPAKMQDQFNGMPQMQVEMIQMQPQNYMMPGQNQIGHQYAYPNQFNQMPQQQMMGMPIYINPNPNNFQNAGFDQNQNIPMFVNAEQVTRKVPKKRKPEEIFCRSCQSISYTTVKFTLGQQAYLTAGILCIIGCWPCCLIPFCMDGLQDCQHYCGKCNQHLGTVSPNS